MRIALLLPLLASLAVGCRASDDDAALAGGSENAARASGAPSTPTLGGACSAMARVTRATLRIAIGRDRATSFAAPRPATGTWQGCRLVGHGAVRSDTTAGAPDTLLRSTLASEGWSPDPQFTASGPTETEFGVRRATVLCAVTVTYTGAVARSATTAVGQPAKSRPYRMEIRCTDGAAQRS